VKSYSIGEVSRILDVKPHVIRYWEQEFPLVAPRKGVTGRREYTLREVRLLLRLKHHLHENRYTIEGARKRIWRELDSAPPRLSALAAEIRRDLIRVLAHVRGLGS